jgi:hypothetical protein
MTSEIFTSSRYIRLGVILEVGCHFLTVRNVLFVRLLAIAATKLDLPRLHRVPCFDLDLAWEHFFSGLCRYIRR